jgi:hypothetical protein
MKYPLLITILVVFFIFVCFVYPYYQVSNRDGMKDRHKKNRLSKEERDKYVQSFKEKENRMFPFRYFTDENDRVLPFVAVTGFFREKAAEDKYHEYIAKGIHVFGITAYKSFPNRDKMDSTEGEYERNDTFDYIGQIRDWLCCFRNAEEDGFTGWNRLADISESDFYNAEDDSVLTVKKKYDFIYICNKDSDECPLNGWNAFNRNFDLAKKCFPIMCSEFGLKGLIVGRENCQLEKEEYGKYLEVIGWLDWSNLQEKMRESKFLFVPNIFDASPRVVAECLVKDLKVLMNRNIICGFKYITYETGELFNDETDVRQALTNLINKPKTVSSKKWWEENYSQEKSQTKLRDFLADCFPGELDDIPRVKFIL